MNKLKPRPLWQSQNLNPGPLIPISCPLHYHHLAGFAETLLTSSTVWVKSQTTAQRDPNFFMLCKIRKKTLMGWQYPKSLSSSGHKRRVSPFTGEAPILQDFWEVLRNLSIPFRQVKSKWITPNLLLPGKAHSRPIWLRRNCLGIMETQDANTRDTKC